MPSPFPGMNPYLEGPQTWHDFHGSFLLHVRITLAARLAPAYIVQFEETLFVEEEEAGGPRRAYAEADVSVARPLPNAGPLPRRGGGTALLDPPAAVRFDPIPIFKKHRHLEIRDRQGRRLVTMIELLSPSNKSGKGRRAYRQKRQQTLRAGANFVELDLLRGHGRVAPGALPPCDYYALVARPEALPDAGLWPLALRDPLPTIPIPLRPPDPDAPLDLQAVLNEVYDACRYAAYVYRDPPDPPLDDADQSWADAVRETGAVEGGG